MTDSTLDAPDLYVRLDPHGLLGRIAALPEQIEDAWQAGTALSLPDAHRDVDGVVVLGMGGSGIGGALLQALAVDLGARVPVSVVRGYRLPGWVNDRTLVLASSNSGDTEETLDAFGSAVGEGARCVAITTGGTLAARARAADVPLLTFAWTGEPRSALGWSFVSLLAICAKLRLLPPLDVQMRSAIAGLRTATAEFGRDVPETSNPAKQLARRLAGRLPVFIGAQALAPVAYRWRTQVNENAKSWAIADELPEMNHNAQAGYGLPAPAVPLLHAVILRHADMHPRIRLRTDATIDEMRRADVSCEVIEIDGAGLLAQVLRAVWMGDYVSYYLGLLNGVEPSPVDALDRLKAFMAAHPPAPGT